MQKSTLIFIIFITCFLIWALYVENDIVKNTPNLNDIEELMEASKRLERILKYESKTIKNLEKQIKDLSYIGRQERIQFENKTPNDERNWIEPIPVLVFSCNRVLAIKEHIKKLIKYRPNKEMFPIIVSQDCDNEGVRKEVQSFGDEVQYIKHLAGDKANITIPPNHRMYTAYYRISRHYKLALDYVFEQKMYSSVIITEDDLDIAPDFFSYFSATRYLLEKDSELWCVSAWNDNGKPENIDLNATSVLYRSDFFPGLGWMMRANTWKELGPIWPSGFWDDWLRDPLRRKDRQCIRPEISRTGMTNYGKEGASKGQFFNKHLAKVKVNTNPVSFSKIQLDYLLPQNYEEYFKREVFEMSQLMKIEDVTQFVMNPANKGKKIRVMYTGNIDFIEKADRLHIMHDFKAGVPRTAYDGIVTCFINGVRIFLAPDRNKVPKYDPTWSVPPSYGE
ncbi:unnamed protein product [Caenorhabditis bovis]|uniref:Alpha-1,3-mannosyl-glycoprotein 2-beta-N-acetylglucosaminyltransferase n=1 Tax=Caenorhabditis bovis TaxID=2654633 RepID=A0A8S1EJX1_9PELO|nr:unnamed protein product [Caenorhabditis bovis]